MHSSILAFPMSTGDQTLINTKTSAEKIVPGRIGKAPGLEDPPHLKPIPLFSTFGTLVQW